jgi:hypothetical protein
MRQLGSKIERYGLTRTIDPRHFYSTAGAAVAAFRAKTGAQWRAAAPSRDDAGTRRLGDDHRSPWPG